MAYFVKKSEYKKGTYLQIYFSYRDPQTKKPANRCHKTLGYVVDLVSDECPDPIAAAYKEVEELNSAWRQERLQKKSAKISDISPVKHVGYIPMKSIVERIDVKKDIEPLQTDKAFQFNVFDVMMSIVYARLVHPCSKKKTLESVIPTLIDPPHYSYDQMLECVEFIGSHYSKIIQAFTSCVRETYDLDTSVTLFDCTNFYFEIDQEDEIRRKGPSKEHRKDPILGMGLLLDKNCIPLGMRLYPGNESEKPVQRTILNRLKDQQPIEGRTVIVSDKGLNCSQNIIQAVAAGDGYIYSKSIKGATEDFRLWAASKEGMRVVEDEDGNEKYFFKSRIVQVEYKVNKTSVKVSELQIATYNEKLARKQRSEIMKQVSKAEGLCRSQAAKKEFGDCSRYVTFTTIDKETGEVGKDEVGSVINQKAVDKALACAGFNALITSEIKMNPIDVYAQYHALWRIEESFRCLKSELDARPVFLQKTESIYGHFLTCYLGILLERLFQFKVCESKFSSSKIYSFIRDFKVLPMNNHEYYNLSTESPVLDFITDKCHLPLTNLIIKPSDMKKMLSYHF